MRYRPLDDDIGSSRSARQSAMGPWQTYTPAWTSSGTQPSLGNGTLVGAYRREGTTLHLRGELNVGSTSTVGTGSFLVSLPSGMTAAAGQYQTISAFYGNGVVNARGNGYIAASASTMFTIFSDAAAWFATSTLANGHAVHWGGTIEITP